MKKVRRLTGKKGLINTYSLTNIFLNKRTLCKKKSNVSFGKNLELLYYYQGSSSPLQIPKKTAIIAQHDSFAAKHAICKTNLNYIIMFY